MIFFHLWCQIRSKISELRNRRPNFSANLRTSKYYVRLIKYKYSMSKKTPHLTVLCLSQQRHLSNFRVKSRQLTKKILHSLVLERTRLWTYFNIVCGGIIKKTNVRRHVWTSVTHRPSEQKEKKHNFCSVTGREIRIELNWNNKGITGNLEEMDDPELEQIRQQRLAQLQGQRGVSISFYDMTTIFYRLWTFFKTPTQNKPHRASLSCGIKRR